MTTIDVKNAKAIKNLTNNKEIIKISDPNDPTKIYWQKITDVVVTYTINTGVASITIVGNDGVTYVNAASTSGSVNIPKGITITCSATVQTGYNAIPNTTQLLNDNYTYSPTTSILKYTVTLASTYGHWEKNNVTVTSITNVPYGTTITKSGQTITVSGFGTYNFVVNSDDNYYTYSFNSIAYSSPVTAQMSVLGKATRSTRYYSLTFENDSNHTVTVYFKIGSGGWSSYSVDDTESRSVSTTYNGSIQVYFKYGTATSSTITKTMTSNQTVSGNCSSTNVYDWQWNHVTTPTYDGFSNMYWYNHSIDYYADAYNHGSQYNLFARNGASHIRIMYKDSERIAPVPSNLPSGYQYNYSNSNSCVKGSGSIQWYCQEADPDDEEYYEETHVSFTSTDVDSTNPTSIEYGNYTYGYIRTDYSVWWN